MKVTVATYQQLDQALTTLGFSMISTSEALVYKQNRYDAVIILPPGSPTNKVRLNHLLTAIATVVGKGVADEAAFQRALRSKNGSSMNGSELKAATT